MRQRERDDTFFCLIYMYPGAWRCWSSHSIMEFGHRSQGLEVDTNLLGKE